MNDSDGLQAFFLMMQVVTLFATLATFLLAAVRLISSW